MGLLVALDTINQILAAGIAITAFSLLLYALTFNLLDRVARSFAMILACVVIVFTAKAIGSTTPDDSALNIWLHVQWIGVIFLPPAYLHFSDALLSTTGRPSHGKRRWAVRLTYLFSVFLLFALATNRLVGSVVVAASPAPHLQRTILTDLFTLYYGFIMLLAWINFARAFRRTLTHTTRRRMIYLLAGATAPALGSYPYLLFGPSIAASLPLLFWILATLSNLLTGSLVIVMAYSVAFFGVPWPDRVVKSRLFKWLMRGPVTASFALALTTLVRRAGVSVGVTYSALVPIVMVTTILLFEFTISLLSPIWERWLFFGKDRDDLRLLQSLEARLLTRNDLRQFLEVVVATVCDRLQVKTAFVGSLNGDGLELVVKTGDAGFLEQQNATQEILELVTTSQPVAEMFSWGDYYLIPLRADAPSGAVHGDGENGDSRLTGVLGISRPIDGEMDDEQLAALSRLSRRAALALQDRHLQQEVFQSLQSLSPQVDLIQRLRAVSRYDGAGMLLNEDLLPEEDMTQWVKDALTHYWGGPKLTESPLLKLQVVRDAIDDHEGNPANALRAILKRAILQVRPEGERRFTGEWILFNILEMKFMEGRKVREIAMRLAMSEADLYRKQRVAVEAVTHAISEMEEEARQGVAKS
ncbi:MAG: histidine kinase N-terminal 7TM domain-containing protein [Anaerolineaceae bacterium]|nr:histidine kinase N-terminal 7TM domain-containing protein [Anaerolineaceae bacterium]